MNLPAPPRLFLIDGYALIYRAFYALMSRPLTTSKGENTSIAWGIATFLQRFLAQHNPEYLAWVNDSGYSFREEKYPAYKATREKLTEELQDDFDRGMMRIADLLDAYHVPVITVPGYEADDVIAAYARLGALAKVNVVIVTGDKDFHQLVRPGVWILNPGRGGSAAVEEHWVDVENAGERLGVPPERVTDYLALVGDSSDNVPGVRGIGDKTARELVTRFGPLEEILRRAEEMEKKRVREALLEHAAMARLSKELVTLREDIPVDFELERMRVQPPDVLRLRALFTELEFNSLARELPRDRDMARGVEAPAEITRYVTVESAEQANNVVRRARELGTFAVDTETVIEQASPVKTDPLRSTLVSVSIALAPGEAYYFPFRHRQRSAAQGELLIDVSGDRSPTDAPEERGLVMGGDEESAAPSRKARARKKIVRGAGGIAAGMLGAGTHEVRNLPPITSPEMAPLRDLLADPAVRKTAQNAKYDLLALRHAGVELAGLDFDTMLASYVLDPGRRSHGLDVLSLDFLDHQMTSYDDLCGKGKDAIPFDECPVEAARDYSCEDADMTLRLRGVFEPQLATHSLTPLLRDVEMPLVGVLAEMEWNGVAIDLPWFATLKERFERERHEVEKRIYEVAGTEFNINSNLQLREILFARLGLPVKKRTSTKEPSTDASVLQDLAEEGHALPELLMEFRELSKLESTYLDTLPELVNPRTGRLHTSFNQTVAATGRLSSSEPNLQNIPIRRELGRDIRKGFVPRDGWSLLAADYSQIELRLLAHLSGDPAFVEAFHAGGDIHRQTAAIIFDVPIGEVTSEMRGRAKTINFATIYGQGPMALSKQLKIEIAEAKGFIARYFERFAGIRGYLDSTVDFARENGYVQTIFGRRRYIPELRDRNFNIRAFGERTAANSPIQGSAADLIKIAMIRIHRLLRERGMKSLMLLQVHDELVFEVPEPELDQARDLVKTEMEAAAELSVPLVVDLGGGKNWLETKV